MRSTPAKFRASVVLVPIMAIALVGCRVNGDSSSRAAQPDLGAKEGPAGAATGGNPHRKATTVSATTQATAGALVIVITKPVPPDAKLELPIARVSGREQNDVGAFTEEYFVHNGVARISLAPGFYRVLSWRIATEEGRGQIPFDFEDINNAAFITIRPGEDYVIKLRPKP